MRELDAVAECQVLEVGRQVLDARHLGLVHEHRDHRDVARERAGGLEADEVVRVVDAAPALRIGDGETVQR